MATEFARSQSVGLSCVRRKAGTLSEIHAKTDQHCRTEYCPAVDLPQEFIDKAILSFRKRLRSCVAAAGGQLDILNNQFKYREGS